MQTGFAGGFDCLYRKYYSKVFANVRRMTSNSPWSEDIVQDIFLKLWSRYDQLSGIASTDDWLYIITRNQVIDFSRRKKREAIYNDSIRHSADGIYKVPVDTIGYAPVIVSAIHHLPGRQRTVYLLVREKEWKIKQVAGTLNISEQTTKNHLGRALKALRKELSVNLEIACN